MSTKRLVLTLVMPWGRYMEVTDSDRWQSTLWTIHIFLRALMGWGWDTTKKSCSLLCKGLAASLYPKDIGYSSAAWERLASKAVCLSSGCYNKGLYTAEIYSSQFWRLEAWDQSSSTVECMWEPSSPLQTTDFSVYSPMSERKWGSALGSLYKSTNPTHGGSIFMT